MLPPLYAYSDDVQLKALDELNVLATGCARLAVDTSHCSALQTMMPDYLTVRNKLRDLGAKPQ
ncbi:hypothetical protein [Rhodopila sp.]|uniref:hypothetical protein n=1 Tax=Rhodopila sp. TaxID=2480087 RepID=UPI003D116A72